jgi:hypothetical protein
VFGASVLFFHHAQKEVIGVAKVKTFSSPLKIFETAKELELLDAEVNRFLEGKGVKEVVSVSDTCTADGTGATIGIIRVVTYDE